MNVNEFLLFLKFVVEGDYEQLNGSYELLVMVMFMYHAFSTFLHDKKLEVPK